MDSNESCRDISVGIGEEDTWEAIEIPISPEFEKKIDILLSCLRINEIFTESVVKDGRTILRLEGDKPELDNFRIFVSFLKKTNL